MEGLFTLDLSLAAGCDGLLLPGGGDISPARYGQENLGSGEPDLERDAAELQLVADFTAWGKPILGICRGIQMINVALGGTLIQDIPQLRITSTMRSLGTGYTLSQRNRAAFWKPFMGKISLSTAPITRRWTALPPGCAWLHVPPTTR